MSNESLRNYLRRNQLMCYKLVSELKSTIISGDNSNDTTKKLIEAESKLTVYDDIIKICELRRKF